MCFPNGTEHVLQVARILFWYLQETVDSWHSLKFHRLGRARSSVSEQLWCTDAMNQVATLWCLRGRNVPASSRRVWEEYTLQGELPWRESPLPLCSHSTRYQSLQQFISQPRNYSSARLPPPSSLGGAPTGRAKASSWAALDPWCHTVYGPSSELYKWLAKA